MTDDKLIIVMSRRRDGWAWSLVLGEGAPVAAGAAPGQLAAMEMAWRAARAMTPAASRLYPDIVIAPSTTSDLRDRAA